MRERVDVRGKLDRATRLSEALGVLFRATSVPVIALLEDGHIVAANDAMLDVYGYPIEEVVTMRIHDLIHAYTQTDSDLARAFRDHDGTFDRRLHRRKDGTTLWVVPSPGPIVLDGTRYIVSVLKDVTPLVEAEEKERHAKAANLADRMLILDALHAMLGEREVEPALAILSNAFRDAVGLRAGVWTPIVPGSSELRRAVGDPMEVFVNAEMTMHLQNERNALRAWETRKAQVFRLNDTSPGSVEHFVKGKIGGDSFVAPLVGRDGVHGIVYATVRPGTDVEQAMAMAETLAALGGMVLETVQLERRAKKDEERAEVMWHAASERLTDGIALLDRDLRIVRVNSAECALMGMTREQILGKPCHEVFDLCRSMTPCPHKVAQTEQLTMVREIQGERNLVRVEIIPVSPNDADIAVIHVAHDLSPERAMRTRLLSADRLATIGRLAAGVAHEVNNPAAFVTVNLGVLRDRFAAGAAHSSDVLPILEESLDGMNRIREIVRDLKGFARERSRDVIDLSQIAHSAIRMAAHETRGRAPVERVLGDNVLARARGARIAQVVLNLLVNAAQAIPPGHPHDHRIVVRTYQKGARAVLEVSDTGHGVPDDLKTRIFEPFFTTHEATGGTGLGLWLARGIIDDEGGTITVGDRPGGGATFTIDLPAHVAPVPG